MPVSRLAEAVGLSAPPVHERLARLERAGVIRGYTALIDRDDSASLKLFDSPERAAHAMRAGLRRLFFLGLGFTVFVQVTLGLHREGAVTKFRDAIGAVPQMLECHHLTGTADFLLKVVCRDTAEYEDLVLHTLTRLPGVERLNSSVVLSTFKAGTALPLE